MAVDDVRIHPADGRGMTRRELLAALAAVGAIPAVAACTPSPSIAGPPPGVPAPGAFPDGVIAGDPLPDGTVIWTRVAAAGPDEGDRTLTWMVGDDPALSVLRAGGVATASASSDRCVKVRVTGLQPDRWYWYRFEVDGEVSRTGRLRTAPATGASVEHLRFAFGSCQQINPSSWFVAHRRLAEEGLDFFVHLGDYVYVSDTRTLSLDDYRGCYREWRRQPLLRDFHAEVPMVAMWDDGEFVNGVDSTMAEPRFSNAKQAWFDHMPVFDPGDRQPQRHFGWGDLADVFMLDVRAHRDPPVAERAWDPTRTTLGAAQYAWFTDALAASRAAWRLVGNPYNLNVWKLVDLEWLRSLDPARPPDAGLYAPNEAWDNYARERQDLMRFLLDHGIGDTAFCSGHTHVAMAADLRPRPGEPVAATDVVAGSLTADPDIPNTHFPDLPRPLAEAIVRVGEQWIVGQNPDMQYLNLMDQGWVTVDVTPGELRFDVRGVDTRFAGAPATTLASFRVERGRPGLQLVSAADRGGIRR